MSAKILPIKILPIAQEIAQEKIEAPKVDGHHFFENWCNACGSGQEDGECEVCPHMPGESPSAHYIRRPCRACGSADLRSVRVRAPL